MHLLYEIRTKDWLLNREMVVAEKHSYFDWKNSFELINIVLRTFIGSFFRYTYVVKWKSQVIILQGMYIVSEIKSGGITITVKFFLFSCPGRAHVDLPFVSDINLID